MVWTYTPRYETIEQAQSFDIAIAERKELEEVVKPYKLVYSYENHLTGTFESEPIDQLLGEIQQWSMFDLKLMSRDYSLAKMHELLERPNQLILYYPDSVPLAVYSKTLKADKEFISEEVAFDRIIIDWSGGEGAKTIHLLNRKSNMYYRAKLNIHNESAFMRDVVMHGEQLGEYVAVQGDIEQHITVPKDSLTVVRNTFYQEDNISPNRFRDALFSDPNAVRRSQVDAHHEEYGDDHALMTVNTETKVLNFAAPAAENQESGIPSELLHNAVAFINEHNGWTDEFRYKSMTPFSRYIRFQLYVNSLPVFSENLSATEIRVQWGEHQIYRYIRPYYTLLDLTRSSERDEHTLPPGSEIAEQLMKTEKVDFNSIEEIAPGYLMVQDVQKNLLIMEPCWFYLLKGTWFQYSPEEIGGENYGLE